MGLLQNDYVLAGCCGSGSNRYATGEHRWVIVRSCGRSRTHFVLAWLEKRERIVAASVSNRRSDDPIVIRIGQSRAVLQDFYSHAGERRAGFTISADRP